jgi:hypothetical protein
MPAADTKLAKTLVGCLSAFNRKERYWLLRNALGDAGAALPLSKSFVEALQSKLPIKVDPNAWWAMDYHFDWLIGALAQFGHGRNEGLNPHIEIGGAPKDRRAICGNQEDIDFIVAFDTTIVLIEAKGVGSWSNSQLLSKWERLHGLVQVVNPAETGVKIYFVLMSPEESEELKPLEWPKEIILAETQSGVREPFFIELKIPDRDKFLRIERMLDDKPSSHGDSWRASR